MAHLWTGATANGRVWCRWPGLVVVLVGASACGLRLAPSQPVSPNLHQVAAVSVESPRSDAFPTSRHAESQRRLEGFLVSALTDRGFVVVGSSDFGLADRAEVTVVERRAMQRVAERLFRAWKESAILAGKLTEEQAKGLDRVPSRGVRR